MYRVEECYFCFESYGELLKILSRETIRFFRELFLVIIYSIDWMRVKLEMILVER